MEADSGGRETEGASSHSDEVRTYSSCNFITTWVRHLQLTTTHINSTPSFFDWSHY